MQDFCKRFVKCLPVLPFTASLFCCALAMWVILMAAALDARIASTKEKRHGSTARGFEPLQAEPHGFSSPSP